MTLSLPLKLPAPRLRHAADGRSLAFLTIALGTSWAGYTGLARHPAIFATSVAFAFVACVVNHNHQHHAIFRDAPWNRLVGVLITWATGQPARAMVPSHLDNHHLHAGGADDMVRPDLVQFRWNLVNLLVFPFVALAHYWPQKHIEMGGWREANPARWRQLRFERLAFYPLLGFLVLRAPGDATLFLGLPWLVGQWSIIAINLVQHDGCDPKSEFAHSRDFLGKTLNWCLCNNGYHTAHHLAPSCHWSQLPQVHQRIASRIPDRLQNRSLAGAVYHFYLWPGRRSRSGSSFT